jgi:hypothetical protein
VPNESGKLHVSFGMSTGIDSDDHVDFDLGQKLFRFGGIDTGFCL